MKYCDLHCDALTCGGVSLVSKDNLEKGQCALQCFAAFVKERKGAFQKAERLHREFLRLCKREGYHIYKGGETAQGVNAVFTIENGAALEGKIENVGVFSKWGVKMVTLTWNYKNELGYPCFGDGFGGKRDVKKREKRGLTPFGKLAVEEMTRLSILPDASHLSDGAFYETARICKRAGFPFVVSHAGARSVYDRARNLTDNEIKTLADCGGVAGLYFVPFYLAEKNEEEAQREAALAHLKAFYLRGGEDCVAIGSDFDGAEGNACLKTPATMPSFFELVRKQFGSRVAEKIAFGNAMRVMRVLSFCARER